MKDVRGVLAIVSTYNKYGWALRRLMADAGTLDSIKEHLPQLTDVTTEVSELNVAWFSRPPIGGPVAWEIRYLGEPPFALLENLDESAADFVPNLRKLEARLRDAVASKRTA